MRQLKKRLTESRKGLARLDTNFHEAVRQLCVNHLRVDEDGFAVGAQSRRRVTPFCARRWERTVYKQYSEQGVNILVYNLIRVDSQQRTTMGMRNFSNSRE